MTRPPHRGVNVLKRAGFTLIELIAVMVVIGILAAIALPQFVDISTEADRAVARGICASLHSAAVMLYASNKAAASWADVQAQVIVNGGTVDYGASTCAAPIVAFMPTGGIPCSPVACAAIPATLCTP